LAALSCYLGNTAKWRGCWQQNRQAAFEHSASVSFEALVFSGAKLFAWTSCGKLKLVEKKQNDINIREGSGAFPHRFSAGASCAKN